jgi:hypothetical protein
MPSLGAIQPEVIGIRMDNNLDSMRRILKPKLTKDGIPHNHLRCAFMLAHGIAIPPFGSQAVPGWKGGDGEIEPNPRDVIANYCRQMMYVSGETGEPSVETTGIIEDIVRQQVIEIVSLSSNASTHDI